MSKKAEIQVDEGMIRSMMMREVPGFQDRDSGSPATADDDPAPVSRSDESPPKLETAKGAGRRKKKEPMGNYTEKFLVSDMCRNRVTVNISRELFGKLRKILPVIAPEVTLTSYLNNIVSEHLDQYRDEIMEMYNSETEKDF